MSIQQGGISMYDVINNLISTLSISTVTQSYLDNIVTWLLAYTVVNSFAFYHCSNN